MEKNNLPVFRLVLGENGIEETAVVDEPATQQEWFSLKKQDEFKFSAVNDEKRIIAGPLLVANQLIYRNQGGREFNVFFDAQNIELMAQKFFKEGKQSMFNQMHDKEKKTDGITMYQSFLINRGLGVMPPKGYESLTDGSWFCFCKVYDDEIWSKVKSGEFKGFSIEGNFTPQEVEVTDEDVRKVANIL